MNPQEETHAWFRWAVVMCQTNFRDCFELECRALKYVRDDMGA